MTSELSHGASKVMKLEAKRNIKGLLKAAKYKKDESVCADAISALIRIDISKAAEAVVSLYGEPISPALYEYLAAIGKPYAELIGMILYKNKSYNKKDIPDYIRNRPDAISKIKFDEYDKSPVKMIYTLCINTKPYVIEILEHIVDSRYYNYESHSDDYESLRICKAALDGIVQSNQPYDAEIYKNILSTTYSKLYYDFFKNAANLLIKCSESNSRFIIKNLDVYNRRSQYRTIRLMDDLSIQPDSDNHRTIYWFLKREPDKIIKMNDPDLSVIARILNEENWVDERDHYDIFGKHPEQNLIDVAFFIFDHFPEKRISALILCLSQYKSHDSVMPRLRSLAGECIEDIIKEIPNVSDEILKDIVSILGSTKDERAVGPLSELLNKNEVTTEVGVPGEYSYQDTYYTETIWDPEYAIVALKEIGTRKALEAVNNFMKSKKKASTHDKQKP